MADERGDRPPGKPQEGAAADPALVRHQPVTGGGAVASATFRSHGAGAVFVKTVIPMLTIWTIPESTIIAPKSPARDVVGVQLRHAFTVVCLVRVRIAVR